MAILFEGKKDLVDDVRLDRAEVIAAAAVDAAWGRRWCSRAVHHREYSICLTISVIPRDHPCIFLSIFIYYLSVLQVQGKYSHRTASHVRGLKWINKRESRLSAVSPELEKRK